jgi:hypothetical protein
MCFLKHMVWCISVGNQESQIRPDDEEHLITSRLRLALLELLEASNYAADTRSSRWDFAVSVRRMQKLGLKPADLRWLVKKGYVEHAREVTVSGDDGRDFRPTGDLTFRKRSCFVLSDFGVTKARSLQSLSIARTVPISPQPNSFIMTLEKPAWNPLTRVLTFRGNQIKRFKWQALNQELILDAFEEENWSPVIYDPLPPKTDQDSKKRLQDTIKALNRNHETSGMIRFHGNGTGDGVRWESFEG